MKKFFLLFSFGLLVAAGYFLGVKPADRGMRRFYYEKFLRPRVEMAPHLAEKSALTLGLYRPELPMNFSMFFFMEERLHAPFRIISLYASWGKGRDYDFDEKLMNEIARHGYTPMVTWEPWLAAFPAYKGKLVQGSMRKIAEGALDAYIIRYARSTVHFAHPMYLRFAHEMTNPWYGWASKYGNSPEDYRDAWNRIVRIFREQGARNVSFVWTPYTAADTAFYPGDSTVDVIGLDVFNYGTAHRGGVWTNFYSVCKPPYDAYKRFHKPYMLAEVGTTNAGGSRKDWYRDMFRQLALGTFPDIAAVVFFDNPSGRSPDGLLVDLRLSADTTVFGEVAEDARLLTHRK